MTGVLSDDAAMRFVQTHLGVIVGGVFDDDTQVAFLKVISKGPGPKRKPIEAEAWFLDAHSIPASEASTPT